MKVCFLCDDLTHRSGTGTYALELIPRIQSRGVEHVVFCSAGQPVEELRALGGRPVLTSWSNGYRKPWRAWRDARAVAREVADVDLVHAVVEPYAPLAERLRTPRRPTIITAHGTYAVAPFRHWYQRWLYTRAFRHAAAVACVSRYTARAVENEVGAATRVVYSGVSLERFGHDDTPRAREPLVLCVGALKGRKGQDVLVRAFARVRETVPGARLVLVGAVHGAAHARQLRTLVADHGLDEAVSFEQDVADAELGRWYRRAWVFALTPVNVGAHFEGFGLVYIEAGACGLPAVATRGNGGQEAVLDGKTGLVVPQRDVASTAEALIRLLSNDALRRRMGRAAQRRAEQLTWETTADQYAALYEEAVG